MLAQNDLVRLAALTTAQAGGSRKRVKLQLINNDEVAQSKLAILPPSLDSLADIARASFKLDGMERLHFQLNGADIEDLDVLRDGDVINVYLAAQYQTAARRFAPHNQSSAVTQQAAAANAVANNPFALYYPPPFVSTASVFPPLTSNLGSSKRVSITGPEYPMPGSAGPTYNYMRMVPKRQRYRRTQKELQRDWQCDYPDCGRPYASENSMIQHQRLKHPGYGAHESKGRGRPPGKTKSVNDIPGCQARPDIEQPYNANQSNQQDDSVSHETQVQSDHVPNHYNQGEMQQPHADPPGHTTEQIGVAPIASQNGVL